MDVLSLDELKDMVPEIKSQMNRIIDTAFHLGQQPPQARIDRAVEVLGKIAKGLYTYTDYVENRKAINANVHNETAPFNVPRLETVELSEMTTLANSAIKILKGEA